MLFFVFGIRTGIPEVGGFHVSYPKQIHDTWYYMVIKWSYPEEDAGNLVLTSPSQPYDSMTRPLNFQQPDHIDKNVLAIRF